MTLQENEREQDTFHPEVLFFDSPLSLQFWFTAVSSQHLSMRNACKCECACGYTWLRNHTYPKSNVISTSCQPSKSHTNETSPNSKVKKVLSFWNHPSGLCLLSMRRGHFIWNRWADGFVTHQLSSPAVLGWAAEKNTDRLWLASASPHFTSESTPAGRFLSATTRNMQTPHNRLGEAVRS